MSQSALAFQPDSTAFNFESHVVRVVVINGEPWFIAADLCKALKLSNPSESLKALDDDEKMTLSSTEGHSGKRGGAQFQSVISESGMYTLVLRCRDAVKPGTLPHRFRKWVTAEVLPTIRKTGSYGTPRIDPAELLLSGQSDLTIELPEHIQAALNARAGVLAGEAFVLIREHLRRRIAFGAVNGHHQLLRDDLVLNLIADGDLGDALAHEYITKIRNLFSYLNGIADAACRSRDQAGEHLKALHTTHW
ncbi:BRO-N domain-containing protein [Bordetella avium]|uniref:BRO-N domain-containing protein n=2 Tax=Bordetella avium TaxID=521 RepID=UPI000E1251E2|nr:Bro-N domain-containing protein [Bordetella avium]WQE34670.1 Bro-N domain-containing protein [Bordetella avium]SUV68308.1 antirepressor [Bordetella avium]